MNKLIGRVENISKSKIEGALLINFSLYLMETGDYVKCEMLNDKAKRLLDECEEGSKIMIKDFIRTGSRMMFVKEWDKLSGDTSYFIDTNGVIYDENSDEEIGQMEFITEWKKDEILLDLLCEKERLLEKIMYLRDELEEEKDKTEELMEIIDDLRGGWF